MIERPSLSSVTAVQPIDLPSHLSNPTASPGLAGPSAWIGREIDDYKIVRVIGAGGMGVVFLAQQKHPKRHVAIKTLHAGLHQAELLARFQQEAEILGRFTHVGIAQIYASGRTDPSMGSVPYIVMEYVEGAPLLEACAALDVRERLSLLRRVCEAIEHAHIRGVIHRDLKPGNILVQSDGQPKVLDFGVARFSVGEERGTSDLTTAGMVVGTIAYMSPEQAMGEPGAVDIRTDVYALGMIGYRMLTGDLPYEVTGHNLAHALQQICDVAPTPLSRYDRRFSGDLETIFQKALAKEKDQRYRNAAELSEDLRRFLCDEAILARRASVFADIRRFARRNVALFAAIVIVFVAMIAAVGISTQFALREQAQRREADSMFQLMLGLLSSANPMFAQGREVTVKEVMAGADAPLERDLADAPRARARMRAALAETWRAMGDLPRASEYFLAAERDYEMANADASALASARLGRAQIEYDSGRVLDALEILQPMMAELRKSTTPVALMVTALHAKTLIQMGDTGVALDELDWVLSHIKTANECTQCIASWRTRLELDARIERARILAADERADEALRALLASQQYAIAELGPTDPDTLRVSLEYANLLRDAGKPDAALKEIESVASERERLLGKGHWQTLNAQNNWAMIEERIGNGEQALERLKAAAQLALETLESGHEVRITIDENLGRLLFLAGQASEGEALLASAYRRRVDIRGQTHPETLQTAINLSVVYSSQGRHADAKPLREAAIRGNEARFGRDHRQTLAARSEYAALLRNMGDYAAADAEFAAVLRSAERLFPAGDGERLRVLYQYAGSLQRQGRWVEAERLSGQLLAESRIAFDAEAQHALLAPLRHARSLMGLKRYAEAEPLLTRLESDLSSEHHAQMREMTRQTLAELRAARSAPSP